MADPTQVQVYGDALAEVVEAPIKDAEQLVTGAFVGIDLATGKAEFADDTNILPLGFVKNAKNGIKPDGLLGNASGTTSAIIDSGKVLLNHAVTGASAITDKFKLVYATDGQTLTLTRPTSGAQLVLCGNGNQAQFAMSTFFSPVEALFVSMLGSQQVKHLGAINSNALQGTSAITLLSFVAKTHFKIKSLHAQVGGYDAGIVAGSQALNLKIGAVAPTGGVLTLAYTDCDAGTDLAANVDATAITAANEVHPGDTVSLVLAASGTGFTAAKQGLFNIFMVVEPLPGA